MHRLITILALIALLAAPAQGLAMRMLDESGQPVADEQVQDEIDPARRAGWRGTGPAASAPTAPSRVIIKAKPGAKTNPTAVGTNQ